VAASNLCDRWILILDPFYTTAKRTLARSCGLGETPSLDVRAIITLADYRSAKHPSLALVATSNLCDRWILISELSYIAAKRALARSCGLGETPSLDVRAIITLYLEPVIHTLLTLPPFDLVRARHVRDQTKLTHTWYTFYARARSMRARTGARTQESKPSPAT
jgi:hypothetical protein